MRLTSNMISIALMIGSTAVVAADVGPLLLFKEVKSSLTSEEKSDIYHQLGFAVTKDGQHFVLKELKECGAFDADISIDDLNNDGTAEILVAYGNTCISGATGSSLSLFVKDKAGKYRSNFGFLVVVSRSYIRAQKGFQT